LFDLGGKKSRGGGGEGDVMRLTATSPRTGERGLGPWVATSWVTRSFMGGKNNEIKGGGEYE